MFRPGITWFVQMLFLSGHAAAARDVPASLKKYYESADRVLEKSELLSDLNLEAAAEAEQGIERVGQDIQKAEYWAIRLGTFAKLAQKALDRSDAVEAAWDAARGACSLHDDVRPAA